MFLKPFEIKTINLMLDRYIKSLIDYDIQETSSDEFYDFYDFDGLDEFDDGL